MHPADRIPPRRSSLGLLALAALPFMALACDGSEPAPPPPAVEPAEAVEAPPRDPRMLVFEKTVEDRGPVFDADDLRVRFPFTNEGDGELVIGEIKVTCGCTTTQLARKTFAPGEGDAIEVHYKPAGSGPIRRTVQVHSNDPSQPIVELHIDAVVKPFLEFQPAQILLGERDRNQEHRAVARFRCADPRALVLDVSSMHPELDVRVAGEDEDGWQQLELVIAPGVPWGSFVGRAMVRVKGVTAEGAEPVVHVGRLLVQAMMFDQLRVNPAFLSVGLVQPGAPFTARTEVLHRRGEPFVLTGLRLEDAAPAGMKVTSEPVPQPRSGYTLVVEGDAGDHQGTIGGTLVIESDIPGEPALRLPILGRVGDVQAQPAAPGRPH